jgi:peroxidase
MPSYDRLRAAYGLPRRTLFDASTPVIDPNDPANMAFTALRDDAGNPVALGNPDDAVEGVRATSLASRLKAVYGR